MHINSYKVYTDDHVLIRLKRVGADRFVFTHGILGRKISPYQFSFRDAQTLMNMFSEIDSSAARFAIDVAANLKSEFTKDDVYDSGYEMLERQGKFHPNEIM